jgi:beta-aspartyl-peptidase (threonine type)
VKSCRIVAAAAALGIATMTHAASPVLVIHGGAGVIKREMS